MNRVFQVALIALLAIITVSSVSAQYNEEKPNRFGLKLMSFMPTDSDLKDVGSMWTGVGLDYNLKLDEDDRPMALVTLGINGAEDGPVDISDYSLSYTRLNRTPISATRAKYSGYGAGIHKLKVKRAATIQTPAFSDSTFRPGLHLLYGQEFKDAYFAELRYDYVTKWNDNGWGGISLNIGSRVSF